MLNKSFRTLVDEVVDFDGNLSVRKTKATLQLIWYRWKQTSGEALDMEQVRLYLAGGREAVLTDEQKALVDSCRLEIDRCFRDMVFQLFLCHDMQLRHTVRGTAEYLKIFASRA